MKANIIIRVFIDDVLHSEEKLEMTLEELDRKMLVLAKRHALMAAMMPTMIEFELVDEPPATRFLRIGTDTRRMVNPVAIKPLEKSN